MAPLFLSYSHSVTHLPAKGVNNYFVEVYVPQHIFVKRSWHHLDNGHCLGFLYDSLFVGFLSLPISHFPYSPRHSCGDNKKVLVSPLSACSQRGTGESTSALFSTNGGCIVIKQADDKKCPRKLPELVQMDTKYRPFYCSSHKT